MDDNNQPQLYNSGYYQLFVRVQDKIIAENIIYPANELYETSLVNIKVLNTSVTLESDNILGFSTSQDNIDGLTGEDGIDILGLSDSLSFGQLSIVNLSIYGSTAIYDSASNQILAVLDGVGSNLITEADFTIV